jgi:2-iminobutanoate/2-iminopropanoate deaminase
MIKKELIEVPGLGDSSGYAYAQCAVAGDFVFVAGQTGVDENYNVVSEEFGPQARQVLENVRLALEAAGSGFENIVTMTVYLTEMSFGREFLDIRKEVLGDTLAPSALVGGAQLAFPSLLIEIQATAVRSS